jgi:hypothetical protein
MFYMKTNFNVLEAWIVEGGRSSKNVASKTPINGLCDETQGKPTADRTSAIVCSAMIFALAAPSSNTPHT